MSTALQNARETLRALAEGLPFKPADVPEFRKRNWEPEMVRQERVYTRPSSDQAISRFLAERGTVEILSSDNTKALFKEMHWCGWRIGVLARKRYQSTPTAKAAVSEAYSLVSRMEAAEEELFIANRRLVVACVKPFYWIGQVWMSDFLQEGSRALTNAIRKFDPMRGTPFYAYAQVAIQNRLRNYFRDHVRSGSLGIRPTEAMLRIVKLAQEWKAKHGENPPDEVLEQLSGIPLAKLKKLKPYMSRWDKLPSQAMSLDAMLGDSESSMHELIEDTDAVDANLAAQKTEIWGAIERLPERSAYILRLRFIEGRTLEETGQMLDLTRARIKQIQDDSLQKLRNILRRGQHNE